MSNKKAIATISIGADPKQLEKDLALAKKKLRAFGKDARKLLSTATKAGKSIAGGIAGMVGGGFGIQAAGGITDMVGDVLAFEKTLVRFQIAAGKSSAEMAGFRAKVLETSAATGVASNEILAGAQTYVDLTGDVAGAGAAMSSFARIAQASGSSVSDIATATAALKQSFNLDAGDIERTFSGLISQGKKGAVSLKDFAGELASLAPRWSKFAGATSAKGVAEFGAAFQVARQGFGSASEAATGLEALMGALTQNATKFEAAGVKVFDKHPKTGVRTLRSFDQIMASIGQSRLMKDPTLLAKAMGSKEAAQTFDMLGKNVGLFRELVVAGGDAGAVQRDLDTYQQSAAGKIEQAWNGAKVALAEAFTPDRIARFADMLQNAAKIMAKIVEYAGNIADFVDGPLDQEEQIGAEMINQTRDAYSSGAGKSPEAWKAELGRRALKLAADPSQAGFTNKAGTIEVARRLAKEAGIVIPQDDAWSGHGRSGSSAPVTPDGVRELGGAVAGQIAAALAKSLAITGITVKIDSSKANDKLDNAPAHRKGR